MKQLIFIASLLLGYAAHAAEINVKLSPLKNVKGEIVFGLFEGEKGYKDQNKPTASGRFEAADKNTAFVISNVADGEYSLVVYQDENKNGKLDMGMFGPKEPYGFSRNPKIKFSAPKYKDVVFKIEKQKNLPLEIKLND